MSTYPLTAVVSRRSILWEYFSSSDPWNENAYSISQSVRVIATTMGYNKGYRCTLATLSRYSYSMNISKTSNYLSWFNRYGSNIGFYIGNVAYNATRSSLTSVFTISYPEDIYISTAKDMINSYGNTIRSTAYFYLRTATRETIGESITSSRYRTTDPELIINNTTSMSFWFYGTYYQLMAPFTTNSNGYIVQLPLQSTAIINTTGTATSTYSVKNG